MAIGKRRKGRQQELFVAASEIRVLGNPFYRALDKLLEEHGFDDFAEETCREFYAEKRGRPSIPPGVYFRMLMVGYLEGIGSERRIAWRCADSISLREFLGYGLAKNPPEHSSLSKTRKRLSVEAHAAVFSRVLELLGASGLLSGKTLGVDATTLEAKRGDALDRAARRREGLRGVAGAGGAGVRDRDADAARSREAGPEASEEGLEQGLGASARPGGADHEDEGRQDAPGAQVRAGGRHGDRGGGRGDGADDGRRRHGLAAEHAGRGGAAAGGGRGGAQGSGGRQGLPFETRR